jgi:hypothetical protein
MGVGIYVIMDASAPQARLIYLNAFFAKTAEHHRAKPPVSYRQCLGPLGCSLTIPKRQGIARRLPLGNCGRRHNRRSSLEKTPACRFHLRGPLGRLAPPAECLAARRLWGKRTNTPEKPLWRSSACSPLLVCYRFHCRIGCAECRTRLLHWPAASYAKPFLGQMLSRSRNRC